MAIKLISICDWGNCYVLELNQDEFGYSGTLVYHKHGVEPRVIWTNHNFATLEDAERFSLDRGQPKNEDWYIGLCEGLFPEDVDVALVRAEHAFMLNLAYKLKSYDIVWKQEGRYHPDRPRDSRFKCPDRVLVIRIPESGVVRCPERFFGRVIGKKGVKINKLSEKHGVRINLVRV
ncbi:hypothetical protein KW790_01615 [Candidatus Parcubacteria bacterium]|nr:hypothetical protein [Candidatus Parcubacteria bacterium]